MGNVEVLGRPKRRSLKLRLNENLKQSGNKSLLEGISSPCEPELVYQRDIEYQDYFDADTGEFLNC